MTESLFGVIFMFAIGLIVGACFKRLNPFFMLFGLILGGAAMVGLMNMGHQIIFTFAFCGGVLFKLLSKSNNTEGENSESIFSRIPFDNILLYYRLRSARSRRERENIEDEHEYRDYRRRTQEQQRKAEESVYGQKAKVEEDIRKAKAEADRREAEFAEAKKQFDDEQRAAQEKAEAETLNPNNLADAYIILNVVPGSSLEECRKMHRVLIARYHPDALARNNITGYRLEEAEKESKQINVAFDTIKKHYKP